MLLILTAALAAGPAAKLEYNRDVRPILAENCFACHGPDSAARKAGLRLDQRDAAIDKGAFEPGKPDASEFVERLFLADTDKKRMPPPASHKELKPEQKALLKRWIAEGAEYQPHWAFIAPKSHAVPAVKAADRVRTPIDAFLLADLEKKGLSFAPEADRHTLARRLSLDLTGLPPTPEQVAAFVGDKAPDYYEKYVAQLMATPAWGEHRGRYWLDAARYADTHGIHFDNFREMWTYRDWVVDAFNKNMPFDRFTVEQLAGDLLPTPTLEQKIATGFNRCNITTNEGGAINEEYLVLYTRDRTETASQIWLGLTTGCAVCHDHKFDPLSQKEFYALAAFFNNTSQAAMDGNIKDTPPILQVPKPEDRVRAAAVAKDLAAAKAKVADRRKAARADFDAWAKAVKPNEFGDALPTEKLQLSAKFNEGQGKTVSITAGGKTRPVTREGGIGWGPGKFGKGLIVQAGPAIEVADAGDYDADQPFSVSTWVKFPKRNTTGGLVARMAANDKGHRGWDLWVQGDRIGFHLINTWPGDALKVVGKSPVKTNQWQHVSVTYDGSKKAAGVKIYIDGAIQPVDVEADALKSTTKTTVPLTVGQRSYGERVVGTGLQDVRLYGRALAAAEVGTLAKSSGVADVFAKPADKRTPKELDDVFEWWLATKDAQTKSLSTAVEKLAEEEAGIRGRGTIAHVWNEKPGMAEAFVLARGEYDKRKDRVTPDTPAAMPKFPADLPKNRLGLANWLLRKDNPLTGRVTVNRFWQELFGTGLVRTSGDYGVTGETPSHPELLDWLALEFQDKNWDVKKFFTLMVTSTAYRQAAITTPEKLEKDRDNRLLSRGPRFRMDAEMIRDYAMAAGGVLSPKMGGPSVRPYQPDGVWEAVAMPGSNTRDYKKDVGDAVHRRSLYTFWKRAAPPASMEILNAPNRETCCVKRERTNTPSQALVTLNDVQFVEAARVLAEKAVAAAKDDAGRLKVVTDRVLCRPTTAKENALLLASHAELAAYFKAKPEEAKKLVAFGDRKPATGLDPAAVASWTMLANAVLNLDEVLNK